MASSSSIGNASSTNASSAQAFYTHFRSATDSLLTRLSDDGVTTPQALQPSLATYASLRAELTAAVDSGVLPSHDQGVHKRRLEEVAAVLEDKRREAARREAQSQAKRNGAGFVFKRKQPVATSRTATAVSGNDAKVDTTALNQPQPDATKPVQDQQSTHLTISEQHDTRYTPCTSTPTAASTTPISLDITNISHSILDLRPLASTHAIRAVQIRSVTHSLLLLPPIQGSAMIHGLTQSLLSIPSCHQFRMHESRHAVVELSTKRASVVTIEGCNGVTFVTARGDEVKVQDFDDLINSEQLRPADRRQHRGNFRVVQSSDIGHLAERIDSLSITESTIKDCVEKVLKHFTYTS